MRFSLVLATVNRLKEPLDFLQSLQQQQYRDFEVIVVDQNSGDELEKEVNALLPKLFFELKYQRIFPKGLSHARNHGLQFAAGEIVAFPDDDCEYLPDTLAVVADLLHTHKYLDVVKGRIVDRTGEDSLKRWKRTPFNLKKHQVFFTASSITMFVKFRPGMVRFDEDLGAGTYFGSCEDVDLIYRLLKEGEKVAYFPEVRIYHPNESVRELDRCKINSYGLGFGAYVRKHLSLINILVFVSLLLYHGLMAGWNLLRFDKEGVLKRIWYLESRLKGFFAYGAR
ncbi:MAG TPA: glycosyltransferase family A protein [Marinilabiliaceae bacterium]|nr:glycosyltransferase family A protein [Marinilabiliaceae bacterium]